MSFGYQLSAFSALLYNHDQSEVFFDWDFSSAYFNIRKHGIGCEQYLLM